MGRIAHAFLLLLSLALPQEGAARFLSSDPIPADAESGYAFNRYWYADASPYRYVDPDGRQSMGPSGYGFYRPPSNFFSDTTAGRFLGSVLGDPIALARSDNFNPITREYPGPAALQDAKLGLLTLAIPSVRVGRVAAAGIADDALVVRGGGNMSPKGANSPEGIAAGSGTHRSGVSGFSVESANGATLCQLCGNLPHHYNQVGVTTAGAIRSAGGDVLSTSGQSATHATVTGLSPQAASALMTPTRNPVPKP